MRNSTTSTAASWEMLSEIGPIWSINALSRSLYLPKDTSRHHVQYRFSILEASALKQEQNVKPNCLINIFTRHTKPGGWVEYIDLDLECRSPDDSVTREHASKHFNELFLAASRKNGMEPCPGPLLEGWLKDAGFEGVTAERHVLPVGTWPADKHLVINH